MAPSKGDIYVHNDMHLLTDDAVLRKVTLPRKGPYWSSFPDGVMKGPS
jgi:hypothetical protein